MDKPFRGRLRAVYERLAALTPFPGSSDETASSAQTDQVPSRIGRYSIIREVGRGGMGVVYAAHDQSLERTVAIKTMTGLTSDEAARSRFWREARAAARVNHPNICQIYEIGEDSGLLFLAMEFLEGQSLADHLRQGPLSADRVVSIGLDVLAAVSALHSGAVIHRDLKPSNIFVTPHGVKLLDFGLARPQFAESRGDGAALTRTGVAIGTPRYMAPEQILGDPVDARTDLFAVGAVLFEMLAGRPAFGGSTVVDILHATLHEQPPALTGSPAVAAIDRLIRRALAKRQDERPPSADSMAEELRAVRALGGSDSISLAQPLTRIVVLPFRVLRPDPDSDFLAFSLPDAIAMSLSSIDSLIVRSSAAAARFAGDTPDLKAVAADADVDRVVVGTLLRSGSQLRVSAQLVDAPGGTLLSSHTVQASFGDLFQLQDEITHRVVTALSLPLKRESPSPRPDVPIDARAYEFYLRGNELARTYDGLARARDAYGRCLEVDPGFAPAWAQLGRCHRVIGKYIDGTGNPERRAEDAFRRALDLNPRLSIAHKYYAQLEADVGHASEAVVRLLVQANRHGNDPELFAGLVHACRYCGLFDEALAAHVEARRLDPNVPTSLEQTLLMTGDIDRLLTLEQPPLVAGGDDGIRLIALGLAGRRREARELLLEMRETSHIPLFQAWIEYLTAWLDGRPSGMVIDSAVEPLGIRNDPEAIFQEGWLLCDVGQHERGLQYLSRAVSRGYFVPLTLSSRSQFDALRGDPRFEALLDQAEQGRRRALAAFQDAGGYRLLGRF